MTVERTKKELIVRIASTVDAQEIQDILDYIRYKEITSKFKVKQETVDKLASSINKKWWQKNAKRLLNENSR